MGHKITKTVTVFLGVIGSLFAVATTAFAQTNIGQIGDTKGGLGPWGNIGLLSTTIASVATEFTKTISRVISIMTIVAGLYFMFNIFTAAYGFFHAGGSDEKVKQCTDSILHSVVGLIVVIAAYALVSLLGALLGLEILKPGEAIKILGP